MPERGQRLAFLDQAHYSMVKTTTFNGMRMPSIAIWNSQTDTLKLVREFNFSDFERRLS
jgi:carboxynorspermidine decarboxylase